MSTGIQADSHIQIYHLRRTLQRKRKFDMDRYDRHFDKIEHLAQFARHTAASPRGTR